MQFSSLVEQSNYIVFFGGAGVSTESGIPDFRSTDGLYNQQYPYPPETILSHHFFCEQPEEFFRFYRNKMLYPAAKPNSTHRVLSMLEEKGKVKAVITQNIDCLHQAAGSKEVLQLHGSIYSNHCVKCGMFYDLSYILNTSGIPRCSCGGIVKPDVVLYEESLDEKILQKSIRYIQRADMLIVGGTSLSVYPAAGLIQYYHGNKLVLINKSPTPADKLAHYLFHEPIGELFAQLEGVNL